MSKRHRVLFEGALYHVTSRGNNRRPIYLDERDRELFLALLARVSKALPWTCHAFCLMGNHYHLLLETPAANLPAGMCKLNGEYARSFNRDHRRKGHLFEQRYDAVLIERDEHLLEVCRYVVLNPVRAGLCEAAVDWRWSSFRATAGLAHVPSFLQVDWVREQFGRDPKSAPQRYAAFVADGAQVASLQGLLAA